MALAITRQAYLNLVNQRDTVVGSILNYERIRDDAVQNINDLTKLKDDYTAVLGLLEITGDTPPTEV